MHSGSPKILAKEKADLGSQALFVRPINSIVLRPAIELIQQGDILDRIQTISVGIENTPVA
jgi:hypothetical protein